MKKNWKHKFISKSPLKQATDLRDKRSNMSKDDFIRNVRQVKPKFSGENTEDLREYLETNYELPLLEGDEIPEDLSGITTEMFSPTQGEVGNWLIDRKNTGRYDDQLGGDELKRQLTNLAAVKTYPDGELGIKLRSQDFFNQIKEADTYEDLPRWWQGRMTPANKEEFQNYKKLYPEGTYSDFIKFYESQGDAWGAAGAMYTPAVHGINVSEGGLLRSLDNWGREGTLKRHENTHALNATRQEDKIAEIMNYQEGEVDKNSYYRLPTEVYSRLMQLRLDNNLDPNKIWENKDLPYLKDLMEDQELHLLDMGTDPKTGKPRVNDEVLLKLMNEVATNETQSDRDLLKRMKDQSRT